MCFRLTTLRSQRAARLEVTSCSVSVITSYSHCPTETTASRTLVPTQRQLYATASSVLFIHRFSGPVRAIGPLYVCVCV